MKTQNDGTVVRHLLFFHESFSFVWDVSVSGMCCFPASQICLVSWNWHWESVLWCCCLVFGDGENLFECLQFGGVFIVWLVVVCALGGSTKFIFRPRCAEWVPLHELSCRSLVYECRFLLERVLNKNAQDLGQRQFMFCRPCLSDTRCL